MRNYAMFYPQFWIDQGRQLASVGSEEALLGVYLMTCPASNHIGLFHLPPAMVASDLSWTAKGVEKALARVCEQGFARYSAEHQHVWVVEMAKYQIGEALSARDNRIKGIKKTLLYYKRSPLLPEFIERYRDDFHLGDESIPLEAPSSIPLEAKGEKENRSKGDKEKRKASRVELADLEIPPRLTSPQALEAIERWLAYKRSRGQGYSKPEYVQTKLSEFLCSDDLVEAINNSIGNTWAGLFPPKNGRTVSDDDPRGNLALAQRMITKIRGQQSFGEVGHD